MRSTYLCLYLSSTFVMPWNFSGSGRRLLDSSVTLSTWTLISSVLVLNT